MKDNNLPINELQYILNDAANKCMNAKEDNLAFNHGYFVGVSQGIRAMGCLIEFNNLMYRFTIKPDPLKSADIRTYAEYTARIIQNHFSNYVKESDSEHEQAIMDGLEEVLNVCGYFLIRDFQNGFTARKRTQLLS